MNTTQIVTAIMFTAALFLCLYAVEKSPDGAVRDHPGSWLPVATSIWTAIIMVMSALWFIAACLPTWNG